MGQTSPRREKAPSRPHPRPAMWYLSSWRNLPRRSNAGHGSLNKPEITPPSHSNHSRDSTTWPIEVPQAHGVGLGPGEDAVLVLGQERAQDRAVVAHGGPDLPACDGIPQAQGAVVGPGEDA